MSHPSRGNDGRIKGHELLSIQLNVCRSYGMILLAVASSKHKVESFYSKTRWNVHECSKHLSQTHPEHKLLVHLYTLKMSSLLTTPINEVFYKT